MILNYANSSMLKFKGSNEIMSSLAIVSHNEVELLLEEEVQKVLEDQLISHPNEWRVALKENKKTKNTSSILLGCNPGIFLSAFM